MSPDFCDPDCRHMSVTESQQRPLDKHMCLKYSKLLKHGGHHPNILKLEECVMGPLLQEKYWNGDPWRILVICVLLNRTQGGTAEPVIKRFFELWPTAESVPAAEAVYPVIAHLGLGVVRSSYLSELSRKYAQSYKSYKVVDPLVLPGIGQYAYEAWRMFVLGMRDFIPKDKELRRRMEELNNA